MTRRISTPIRAPLPVGLLVGALLLGPGGVLAQDVGTLDSSGVCPPSERATLRSGDPLRIWVDGRPFGLEDAARSEEDRGCIDRDLDRAGLQLRIEGSDVLPALSLTVGGVAVRGEELRFRGYSNYPDWIRRAELRIFPAGASRDAPPLAVVGAEDRVGESFRWTPQVAENLRELSVILRVYDAEGRYDETWPRQIVLVEREPPTTDRESIDRELRIGHGENHRVVANIPVTGRAVTISGSGRSEETTVEVLGRSIPVDREGRFAERRILPRDASSVTIRVRERDGRWEEFVRPLPPPRSEWFHLGVADLTAGKNSVTGPAALVTGRDTPRYRGESFLEGRLAFYLKGTLGEETTLTASADTREAAISELFTHFSARDPEALLRRLDRHTAYPTYGDGSWLIDDAPTQGRFHVRLERRDSHLLWGSFRTRPATTNLVRFNRGLYGGELHHRSEDATRFGERRTQLDLFAADPGTLASREEFRSTGGSLYYLRNRDVVLGSERVAVEVRDRDSGLLLESRTLVPAQDYELNALQGRILLTSPLDLFAEGAGRVRTSANHGDPTHLVVTYEYLPLNARVDHLTTGGRATRWLGDHLAVGVSGVHEGGDILDHSLYGADVTVRAEGESYLRIEAARSDGGGVRNHASLDGGLSFTELARDPEPSIVRGIPDTGAPFHPGWVGSGMDGVMTGIADALRIEGALVRSRGAEAEARLVGAGRAAPRTHSGISGYWQNREAGFAGPGQLARNEIRQSGVLGEWALGERASIEGKADFRTEETLFEQRSVELGGAVALTRGLRFETAAREEHRAPTLSLPGIPGIPETGGRTDLIGILRFLPHDSTGAPRDIDLHLLAQGTIRKDEERSPNDRWGGGAALRINDRLRIGGEVTDGSGGWGGRIATEFAATDRTTFHLTYRMDPDRPDFGTRARTGMLGTGARYRHSDRVGIFAEGRRETIEGGPAGLMHAFGLDLAPRDR